MARDPIVIKKPGLIITEGKEEIRFFKPLLVHLGIDNVDVIDYEGKTNLRPFLKALRIASGFSNVTSLGIVRDADDNPTGAFQSICSSLSNAGLPVPTKEMEPAGQKPRVTVLLLPGGGREGMLEDVCLDVAAVDPAMPCVDAYFDCLDEKSVPKQTNSSKARMLAFLASRPKALRLGESAEAGYWDWEHVGFGLLKEFLELVAPKP